MSEILFWYIRLNPPFLSPDLLGALSRDGREGWLLPSAKARFLGGCPRSGRNQDPQGGEAEAEHRRAAGRSLMFPSRCLRRDGKETRRHVQEHYESAELRDRGPQPPGPEKNQAAKRTRTIYKDTSHGATLRTLGPRGNR